MIAAPPARPHPVDDGVPPAAAERQRPGRQPWGPMLASAAVIAVLAWALWSIGDVIDAVARIETERLPKLAATQRLRSGDLEASIALRNALLLSDAGMERAELTRFRAADGAAAAALSDLEARPHSSEARGLLQDVVAERRALEAVRAVALKALAVPGATQGESALTLALQQQLDAYLARVDALYAHQVRRLGEGVSDSLSGSERARAVLAVGALVATAGLLLLLLARLHLAREALAGERRQVARLVEQRDALVREVHHRIKNHLQGMLALIEGESAADDTARAALSSMRRHVMALVGVHGMQAAGAGERVTLTDLLRNQLPLLRAGHPEAELAWHDEGTEAAVPPAHAVPLALAFTELVANAVKHGTGPVRVTLTTAPMAVRVTVGNAIGNAIGNRPAQAGAQGQGLGLAQALLQGIGRIESGPGRAGDWIATMDLDVTPAEQESPWPAS